MYSIQHKRQTNLRIMQEYFQPKIGRIIRIFSLGRKNNILIKKKKSVVDNLNLVENNFQIARNFDHPTRRAVKAIKTAN